MTINPTRQFGEHSTNLRRAVRDTSAYARGVGGQRSKSQVLGMARGITDALSFVEQLRKITFAKALATGIPETEIALHTGMTAAEVLEAATE